jgi:hypothetical protein
MTDFGNGSPAEICLVRELISLAAEARASRKLPTEQRLSRAIIIPDDPRLGELLSKQRSTIATCLGTETVCVERQAERYVSYQVKPNLASLRAKFDAETTRVTSFCLAHSNAADLYHRLKRDGKLDMIMLSDGNEENPNVHGVLKQYEVTLTAAEVEITLSAKRGFAAASGQAITLVLALT